MSTIKYRLKGHESFILRDGWLNKGLQAVYEDPKVFSKNSGADELGVGTNMAKAIRYWLKAANLIKENSANGALLTTFGAMIWRYDPYLEDEFSLWIIHINIVRNFQQATAWNLFFNEIEAISFSRENLFEMLKGALENKIGDEKISSRSLMDDCSAILAMYTENRVDYSDPEDKKNSPFATLGLLYQNENLYEKRRPDLEKLDILVILYMIQDILKNENSLLIDDIVEKANLPGKVLNLGRVIVNEFLDSLQEKGYIVVNRTAGLDVVYSCCDATSEEILELHYERGL